MKKLAIIGAGRMACIFAENAKTMGIKTYCFAWAEGALAKDVVDCFYPISIFEKDEKVRIRKDERINAVVATTELTISIAAYIAKQLNLNGIPLEVAEQITNKYKNREKVKIVKGLEQPKYLIVHKLKEIEDEDLNFPIILKPISEGGKRGVVVVNSAKELSEAFEYTVNASKGEKPAVIVEEYISGGQEYSVESLSFHGKNYIIQVTEKDSSGAPHCVEIGHHQPASLSD